MPKKQLSRLSNRVVISPDPQVAETLRFTFLPAGADDSPAGRYLASATGNGGKPVLQWIQPPPQPEVRAELEGIVRERLIARQEWLKKLSSLVAQVATWAHDLDWSTRVVEKSMEDAEIGNYSAPGLLLQWESVRLFLEPVARSVPGTDGIVELYLMPSYDDIAGLYYYGGRWNVHYVFDSDPAVATVREGEAKPLTKSTLSRVLDEMKAHAAAG
jgi:hypothetical protein